MLPNPILPPCPFESILHLYNLSPQKKTNKNTKKTPTNQQTKNSLHGGCSVSQYITQYTLLSTHLYLQVFIEMRHWAGSRPLTSAPLSTLHPHQDFP